MATSIERAGLVRHASSRRYVETRARRTASGQLNDRTADARENEGRRHVYIGEPIQIPGWKD